MAPLIVLAREAYPTSISDRAPGVPYSVTAWLETQSHKLPEWLADLFRGSSDPGLTGRFPRRRV